MEACLSMRTSGDGIVRGRWDRSVGGGSKCGETLFVVNDSKILDSAGGALQKVGGQETTALSNDAYTFGSDEQAYNPSGGPTDPSYTQRLIDEEQALVQDCPGGEGCSSQDGERVIQARN